MARQIEIRLLGQKIVLKSNEPDEALIQQVVALVSSKISSAESRAKGSAPHQVALLALLDLAEEYVKAKRRTADHLRNVETQSHQVARLIEAEIR